MTAFAPLLLLFAAEVLSEGNSTTAPECGIKRSENEFPWHAALYLRKNEMFLCGGTIISVKVILTAAHCLYGSQHKTVKPAEDFVVAVGMTHSSWTIQDKNEQRFEVQEIIMSNFKGEETRYADDIAGIILNGSITTTQSVMPACLHLTAPFTFKESDVGSIPVWDISVPPTSRTLNGIAINHDDFKNCRKLVKPDFFVYITHDKFCAAKNESFRGNSGTGLTFPRSVGAGKKAHFVEGILSTSDSALVITFTNITAHGHWIKKLLHEISEIPSTKPEILPL